MNVITSVTTTTTTAPVREYLTAARTYYVRTDGSNSNDGLSNTSGGAFLTIQYAVDIVCNTLDINSQVVVIEVADGAYDARVTLKAFVGSVTVTLRGNITTPANVTISVTGDHAIVAVAGRWAVQGFKVSTTGANFDGLSADGSVRVTYSSMNFGSCGRFHVYAIGAATVVGTGASTISGGGFGHLGAATACRLALNAATLTLSGTPAFNSFAVGTYGGVIEFYSTTFSGAATGKRYDVSLNAVIVTSGAGATYLPGDAAGTSSTGGQYN